ncbi:MAG: PQQ-binding-like beta-propeller repeat protein [Mariniblastus sp.]|nr:PQQ-binding-like beta-propeller repeat protein [Mariniblastus sp.]
MFARLLLTTTFALVAFPALTVCAEDWSRFRGPAGSGVATDFQQGALPSQWSPQANLAWKTELPGPGASSPIIVDGKAIVTCYSGYGLTQEDPGEMENLVRHLVCIDMKTGEKLWQKDIKATLPEDPYTGIGVTAHGYASHTPVSDGENVYAFFGKGGVHAFDLEGNELWQAEVGKESDPAKWGSSSSPVVYGDTVIVTASAESQSIVGLDKKTGKERWRQEAKGLDGMWGTPTFVPVDDNRTDLVMSVAKELWGMDPDTGKLRWYANGTDAQQSYASVVLDGNRVFAITGRGGGSIAVDAGGSGDISESHTVWTGRDNGSFGSPVLHDSKLYSVNRGIITVIDAKTGERIEQVRLKNQQQTGGRFGSLDYASPIVAGKRLYYLNGSGQMYVFEMGDKLQPLAINKVTADKEVFWGTPAVGDDQMVLRSSQHLYCIADKGEEVSADSEAAEPAAETPDASAAGGGRPGGGRPGGAGRPSGGRGNPGGGGSRFDPMTMFNRFDTDKDGKVTEQELEGNQMADRLKTLDKDGDKAISQEEFSSGVGALFSGGGRSGGGPSGGGRSGGGRSGGGRSGGGRSGGGGYGGRGEDNRPDRPQRPESDKN